MVTTASELQHFSIKTQVSTALRYKTFDLTKTWRRHLQSIEMPVFIHSQAIVMARIKQFVGLFQPLAWQSDTLQFVKGIFVYSIDTFVNCASNLVRMFTWLFMTVILWLWWLIHTTLRSYICSIIYALEFNRM